MSEIADLAIAFEARKVSVNQNKDGIILRLSIHPDECPQEVWKDWVGTIYQVALVKVGDDGQPTAHEDILDANQCIRSAGMLARNTDFQDWMEKQGFAVGKDMDGVQFPTRDDETISRLREALGVRSRTEMRTNKNALNTFKKLRERFIEETSGL